LPETLLTVVTDTTGVVTDVRWARPTTPVTPTPTQPPTTTPQPTPPPPATNEPWLKTFQGFGLRDWNGALQEQFGGSYDNLIAHVSKFSTLNLGNVVEWGPGTRYPHPKACTPISAPLSLAGRTGGQFLKDLKARNPKIRIFLYTTPCLDHISGWDANGVPLAVTPNWNPGQWENLKNSINSMVAAGPFDGVYFDLIGPNLISEANLASAVNIVKAQYGKSVMLNVMGADLTYAKFGLTAPLGSGDYVFVEGFEFDSTNGSEATDSEAVAKHIATDTRGVGLAAVVEEVSDTSIAVMQDYKTPSKAYTNWVNGYIRWNNHKKPGWLIEHQRASYDYLSQTIGGA
jgi:hypothetical protein